MPGTVTMIYLQLKPALRFMIIGEMNPYLSMGFL